MIRRRLASAIEELSNYGGLPKPYAAKTLWDDLRHLEAHHSTAIEAVADALARHDGDANGTPWGTVHAFKRLEAPVVILTEVDGSTPQREDLLSIGATRATERLVVLTTLDEILQRARH